MRAGNGEGSTEFEAERAEAERRVGSRTSSGWRIGDILRVNGVGALHEASRGNGDATERALLHVPSSEVERSLPMRAEFQRGAWAAARLSHARAFVPVDESSTVEGLACIAWPLPPGRPLADFVAAGGGLGREDALRILEHVLDVLESAHATSVIHGAIDPWSVWQTPRRSARVLLFSFPPGVRDPALYDPRGLVSLRRDAYQAPELAEGIEPATEASDLYSLAMVVASAMVGPVPPRLGRALALEKLMMLGVDEPLAAVLAFALARSPVDRYASAIAMLKDVRRVIAGETPRLELAGATGGSFEGAFAGESTSSIVLDLRTREKAAARARSIAEASKRGATSSSQAGGNAFLLVAMVAIVGVATWVIWKERAEAEATQEVVPASAPSSPR
jgi:serine/threonine-protein kinase